MLSSYYKKKLDELIFYCKKNLPSNKVNENLIAKAFKYALEAHKLDKRASGEPYFSHPYEVALIVAKEIPLDDISVASALLHDVIEDTNFTIKDIREEFGEEVAEIVDGATKIDGIFDNYELQQIESYKKLLLSMTSDIRVMLIKFADRLHNLRTIEFLSNPRQIRMAQETVEIYAPFAHRFGLSSVKTELEELSFKYLDRKTYDEIAKKLNEKKRERERFVKKFIEPIKQSLEKEGLKFEIQGRAKSIYSIYKKIKQRNKSFDEIYDLFAVRIIIDTKNKNDCFNAYGLISQIYIPVPERFKDYISLPKQNGYQSIHTTLISKEGKMVEVQIKTREMHEIAEKGIAAHWKYKENTNINEENLEKWMKYIRETFENVGKDKDVSEDFMESFKLNLYQDEIYVFTPKGDLKVMPAGTTALDFAFEIHTQIGMKCIGAKVNGKIVPINTILKSGNQVEILTSKNQTPKLDWEQFVVTHKAKSDLRKFFNAEKRDLAAKGKEIFEKKLKKNKLHINEDSLLKLIHKLKFKEISDFYYNIATDEDKANEVIGIISDKGKILNTENKPVQNELSSEQVYEKFINDARAATNGISVNNGREENNLEGLKYEFAKCCNPIPGDEVLGFITKTEGIKIHRKNCKNIVNLFLHDPDRILEINWNDSGEGDYTGGLKIIGEDRPGMLNDITNVISKNFSATNIKSVVINTKGAVFEGTLILNIKNLKQLNQIIEKLNSQEGIFSVSRFEE
ncbi:MAG: bifunctional (p)ppGpp synthetase/guanosine-3',5'-bis(diphosphate) 3'-pyrophosphohydrolase [Ignavibacteria bacterium]|nr:bifunctional (p)ppGpp synthetase/guanosine-3',5'-bis(diphosphate) 3'-pyrophosphohydrolase [Ignavibacteria bacterium]